MTVPRVLPETLQTITPMPLQVAIGTPTSSCADLANAQTRSTKFEIRQDKTRVIAFLWCCEISCAFQFGRTVVDLQSFKPSAMRDVHLPPDLIASSSSCVLGCKASRITFNSSRPKRKTARNRTNATTPRGRHFLGGFQREERPQSTAARCCVIYENMKL